MWGQRVCMQFFPFDYAVTQNFSDKTITFKRMFLRMLTASVHKLSISLLKEHIHYTVMHRIHDVVSHD